MWCGPKVRSDAGPKTEQAMRRPFGLMPVVFVISAWFSLNSVGCGGASSGSIATLPSHFPSSGPSADPPTSGQIPDGTVQTIAQSGLAIAGEAWDPNSGQMFVTLRASGSNWLLLVAPDGSVLKQEGLPGDDLSQNEYLVYDPVDTNIYITFGTIILKVTSAGFVSSVFASGFQSTSGITYDANDGNFYVADFDHLDRISPAGVVTPITPQGSLGGGESGIAYDPQDGNLYVADSVRYDILQVTTGGTITPYAGQCVIPPGGFTCANGDADGVGLAAQFTKPTDIAYDADNGLLYVADSGNMQIRQIAPGAVVTTIAGSGQSGLVDGVGRQAEFEGPQNLGYDHANGNLYVSDNLAYYRAVGTVGPVPPSPGPQVGGFVMYPLPNVDAQPSDIAPGPDGDMWFTENSPDAVGRVTMSGQFGDFPLPAGCGVPTSITEGSDGNEWLIAGCYNQQHELVPQIAKVTPTGTFTMYPFTFGGPQPTALARGTDGNVWFSDFDIQKKKFVGKITPNGMITQYNVSNQLHQAGLSRGLTFGPRRDLWVVDSAGTLDQIGVHGKLINAFSLPGSDGLDVAAGGDGNLWVTDPIDDDIIRVTPMGGVTMFPIGSGPSAIAAGPSDIVYFTQAHDTIGWMTRSGSYDFAYVPAPNSAPNSVALGPDGNVWFTDAGANMIGRYVLNPNSLPPGTKVLRPATHRGGLPFWLPALHPGSR